MSACLWSIHCQQETNGEIFCYFHLKRARGLMASIVHSQGSAESVNNFETPSFVKLVSHLLRRRPDLRRIDPRRGRKPPRLGYASGESFRVFVVRVLEDDGSLRA